MSIKKKYKKLMRDPKLFVSDMLIKHHKLINKFKGKKKYDGQNKFTVVSAVYGVEKYLDDYFESLVKQNLDFKKHIHLVMVDDGSKDNSAAIIKKWQVKYPDNITYVYKDNGGQASARNLGMQYVKTKWVTFIDPDDFVDPDYFLSINDYLEQSNYDIGLIGCNLYFYMESSKTYKDTHPLKYRFKNDNKVYSCLNLENNIQSSASTAIFLSDVIRFNTLTFDERVKPSFEDAKFVSEYLLYVKDKKAYFLSTAKYMYRKREDGTSTLDGSWKDKRVFNDKLRYGHLALFKECQDRVGHVPIHVQRQVLYDLSWYLHYLINQDEKLSHLTDEEVDEFYELFEQSMSFISPEVILKFNLAGIWFLQKSCLLSTFKQDYDYTQIAYVEKYDAVKKHLLVSVIAGADVNISCCFDQQEVLPIFIKSTPQIFARHQIGVKYLFWISITENSQTFTVSVDKKLASINVKGNVKKNSFKTTEMVNLLSQSIFGDIWVFMDRDDQADDNAEHLYRYVQKTYPNKKICFILNKSSHDWNRLNKAKFNLIEFGSLEHEEALRNCNKVISSHADKYVHNYLSDNSMLSKSFVFLQHGITKDDLSGWLNSKKNMDVFVTATQPEYNSIVSIDSNYIFTEREVKLTGFPRHDKLWINKDNQKQEKIILIMPTWRNSIVGSLIGDGNERVKSEGFETTQYFQSWYSFLHSRQLAELASQNGFKVIFAPHKNVEMYLDSFELPSFIECWKASAEESMQDLFLKSTFMITDYSSVAFEMAYLNKTTLYYQFDEAEVFSGAHTYQKGYFDYACDGFGPKVNTEAELLLELEKICKNQGQIEDKYLERIKNTFAYQDANNCQRVYEAICDLDQPMKVDAIDINLLDDFAKRAVAHHDINSAISRCEKLLELGNEDQQRWAYVQLLSLYYEVHQFESLNNVLNTHQYLDPIESQRAKGHLYVLQQDWSAAINTFNSIEYKDIRDHYNLMKITAFAQLPAEFAKAVAAINTIDSKGVLATRVAPIYQFVLQQNWGEVVEQINNTFSQFEDEKILIKPFKLELLAARASRELEDFESANNSLVAYEKHTKDDHECRTEIAYLAFAKHNYKKVVSQLQQAYDGALDFMAYDLISIYGESLYLSKDLTEYHAVLEYLVSNHPESILLIDLKIKEAKHSQNWIGVLSYENDILMNKTLSHHLLTLFIAYMKDGDYAKALEFGKNIRESILNNEQATYLEMLGESAILCRDWVTSEESFVELLKYTAGDIRQDVWAKILHIQMIISVDKSKGML